jgi:hypothetical protein
MFVPQCVDDRAAIDVGRTAALWRRDGDERRDGGPLRIGQIGRIIRWRESALAFRHDRLLPIRTACSPSWYHKSGFLIALSQRSEPGPVGICYWNRELIDSQRVLQPTPRVQPTRCARSVCG